MPNTMLVAADYSQLELRVSAYMSRDPLMIDILQQGRDMHVVTAAAIYNVAESAVTPQMRQTAKTVNYLTSYGGAANKMIEGIEKLVLEHPELGLEIPSRPEAQAALNTHRRLYKQYWQWVSWTIQRARINKYSETAFGRPRYNDLIDSPRDDDRTEAERALVNHCIQGTAADLMKMAMVNISTDVLMQSWGDMLLQVHDEIVSVVASDHVMCYNNRIRQHMELKQPFAPWVELVVDVTSGQDWKQCHK